MSETWKQFRDYDYFVSDQGRVKSKKQILNPYADELGYLYVNLYKNTKGKKLRINRIVLECFVGPPPFIGAHAAHADAKVTNNYLSNLRWATPKENAQDRMRHGSYNIHERHHSAKLTMEKAMEIRAKYKRVHRTKSNTRELAKEYGVSPGTIRSIKNFILWKPSPNTTLYSPRREHE
jgi:hypothetical protein